MSKRLITISLVTLILLVVIVLIGINKPLSEDIFEPVVYEEDVIDININEKDNIVNKPKSENVLEVSNKVGNKLNILILGVDSRDSNYKGRADAIVLSSYDYDTGKISLIGIPRDTYVYISSRQKYDKINHSYAYSGIDGIKQSVEGLFNIKINNYVVLNFEAFIDVVDILGGIEVEVENTFTEQDSKGKANAIKIEKGYNILNGEEALSYVRMRKQDNTGDLGRNNRQKQVINSVIAKVKEEEDIFKYVELFKSVSENIKTDFSILEIMTYSSLIIKNSGVDNFQLDGKGTTINGVYYYIPKSDSIETMEKIINGDDNNENSELYAY